MGNKEKALDQYRILKKLDPVRAESLRNFISESPRLQGGASNDSLK
jgi:hypothetical protein